MNSNLRKVKLLETGNYTIARQQELIETDELCNYCGLSENCQIRNYLVEKKEIVDLKIRTCYSYRPLLSFKPPHLGFDGEETNTFRMGPAWFERVKIGQCLTLFDTALQRPFGEARVTRIYKGSLVDMCQQHAHRNHLMLQTPAEEAVLKMPKVLANMYGGGFVANAKFFSVVYFKPFVRIA